MSQEAVAVDTLIKNIVKGGKTVMGYRRSVRLLKTGGLKAVIVAEGSPNTIVSDVKYYARLGSVPVIIYKGSSMDLGALIGRPHPVSVIGIIDPGNISMEVIDSVAEKNL
ncbi:MAG: 50S ribosomal protein L30e [Desulfurococcales archaeon]|nr:50S ribosomal protein L30e [Desulfurococcales archaeon]